MMPTPKATSFQSIRLNGRTTFSIKAIKGGSQNNILVSHKVPSLKLALLASTAVAGLAITGVFKPVFVCSWDSSCTDSRSLVFSNLSLSAPGILAAPNHW